MKTTNVVQAAVDSEGVSDEALEMSIDESSSVFLMDALGKLYSQPARAALREYLANGIDAHIEAGGKRPAIEITLPSTENRVLSIRDFGNGMSEDNFNNILRRYGASTKRHSNKLTGGFGLGAKAGFALTDSFHMTSFQNGKRIKVRIFKNASGKGFIEVVERTSSNEADGMLVEVDIPAGNVEEMSYEKLVTDKFFAAYHDSEIIVTAEERVRANSWSQQYKGVMKNLPIEEVSLHNPDNYEALEYGGTIVGWLGKRHARNSAVRAIIGRVSYEIKRDSNGYSNQSYSYSNMTTYSEKFGPVMKQLNSFDREVILNLPIGSVDLPSSREEITYSERSLKTIVAVAASVHRMVEENVQRIVNAKPSGHEALCEIVSLHSDDYWKAKELVWRGKSAPIEEKQGTTVFKGHAGVIRYLKTTETRKALTIKTVTSGMPSEIRTHSADKRIVTVMITAKDDEEFNLATKRIKTNINDYQKSQDNGKHIQVLLFPSHEPMAEWFEQGEKLTLDEFVAVGKTFRAEKRAEAKALAKARGGNPAFAAPVKTTAATREVFSIPVNKQLPGGSVTIYGEVEHSLLTNKTDFYYLSKAEVKDVSAELSNFFPTRQGAGGSYAYIDPQYAKLLPTLKTVLGDDANIVFLPATRNMEEFKATYPNVPSVVDALKLKLQEEWKLVESGQKKDTYYAEIFWAVQNRSRVSLINAFFKELTPGERVSMNADLLELHTYMKPSARDISSRLQVLTSELLGKDFTLKVIDWMNKKVTVVSNRYPLLTMMNSMGDNWNVLKPEMIRYLKTC